MDRGRVAVNRQEEGFKLHEAGEDGVVCWVERIFELWETRGEREFNESRETIAGHLLSEDRGSETVRSRGGESCDVCESVEQVLKLIRGWDERII